MITVFIVTAATASVVSLPADLAWRRLGALPAVLAAAASALALAAIAGLESQAGLLSGPGAVAALIFGLIAGGGSADALATRFWGPAPRQYH